MYISFCLCTLRYVYLMVFLAQRGDFLGEGGMTHYLSHIYEHVLLLSQGHDIYALVRMCKQGIW